MHRFQFRLQRVLEYRHLQESWAKDAYLAAKKSRSQAESELAARASKKTEAQTFTAKNLEERRTLENYLAKLADDIESQKSVVEILKTEESAARGEWVEAKKKRQALTKLRDAAEIEWQKLEAQAEQKGLDEWSSTRRAA